jgi:hypothetical protein
MVVNLFSRALPKLNIPKTDPGYPPDRRVKEGRNLILPLVPPWRDKGDTGGYWLVRYKTNPLSPPLAAVATKGEYTLGPGFIAQKVRIHLVQVS